MYLVLLCSISSTALICIDKNYYDKIYYDNLKIRDNPSLDEMKNHSKIKNNYLILYFHPYIFRVLVLIAMQVLTIQD